MLSEVQSLDEAIDGEPSFEALKGYVDEILRIENEMDPEATHVPSAYPTAPAINNMWMLLAKASKGTLFSIRGRMKTVLGGIAVSPNEAFLCIMDYIRTTRFIAATCAAIKEAQKRFPGEIIRVTDAGCGPLAFLSIAAMTQFPRDEVTFTLIDVFGDSLACVRQVLATLDLQGYVANILEDDAGTIRLQEKPHVVVSEVMDRALTSETQVPITLNLGPQLVPGGIFVPESVQVHANITSNNEDTVLGRIAEVTKDTSLAALGATEIRSIRGITTTRTFPLPSGMRDGSVYLSTRVDFFGGRPLKPGESAITKPFDVGNFDWEPNVSPRITLQTTFGGINPSGSIKGSIEKN